MAYVVETITEGYEDTPLTKFPLEEDTFPRMSDISVALLPIVLQYNQYISSGNKAAADQLIENNPDLYSCLHDAEKWNMIRDALIAMQRYLLNQVTSLYNQIADDSQKLYEKIDENAQNLYTKTAQNAIGINDNPTEEQTSVVSYSAGKIDSLIENISNQISNVDNTADADKSVKYATSAGSAGTATTLDGLTTSIDELNYVDGITSNIQTQLNSKQPIVTGAATTIAENNLAANMVLVSNGSGKVTNSSNITTTELGYLDGVTSNIQTQLDGKAVSGHTHNYAAASHNHVASQIAAGTLAGKVLANATAVATLTNKQVRNIFANTTAVSAGSAFSGLENGDIYFQYE